MGTQPDTDAPLYRCYPAASTGHLGNWPILFIDQHVEPVRSEDILRVYDYNIYYR
jgi:hypothetical protein